MEVEIKFEPAGRNGVAVVGTYLMDAGLRLGVSIEDDCGRIGSCDLCAVKILKGAEFLSEPTQAELEHLSAERRKKGERLSCQAKIEKIGEICVMTNEKPKPEPTQFETFKKEFAELPLDQKVKNLLDLESITLSDTFSFILNLPYTIGEKIRDGIAEFGFKMEEAEKQAKRPTEHQPEEKSAETAATKGEEKATKASKATSAKAKAAEPKKPAARKRTVKSTDKPNNETSA